LLVVDDGSKDGPRVAEYFRVKIPALRWFVAVNHGKGYSVRHGQCRKPGRIALFTDADFPRRSKKPKTH